ncbi:AEC family transporter [Stackebrandtia nassauensis]|uniref:Auxin Efflux Carrier n=1 Tax=Stackebrandtia nassauensis (strain DSM 44728 / CIP 108903 / NRRL B-16338 / NBRC 102104 / LLR-40K-21) TaxID=446470 RepID=D3Q4Y6_STANL|nr:AEC family transporter [Stackebrandtia nassauensis]ADD42166.1 Auxin Efflux Carrier [Stackebrandtia nassauensis DSM 44728]
MLAAFVPIWFLVGCGYGAARFKLLGDGAARVLTSYAFFIAMPAVLFTNLASARLDRIPLRALLSLASGTVLVGLVGILVARWFFRDRAAGQIMTGMASGYLNSGNLGIPVAVHVLGDTLLIAAVMIFQTAIVTPLFLLAMDAATGAGNGRRRVRLWLAPFRNPIVVASLSGLALNAAGVDLPGLVEQPLKLLGASAVPVALVALGMTLYMPGGSRPKRHWGQVSIISGLKTVAHPLLAYAVARFGFGLDGEALFAVTLFAALPAAQLIFVYADRYRTKVAVARDVVIVSSVASIVVLTGIALGFR